MTPEMLIALATADLGRPRIEICADFHRPAVTQGAYLFEDYMRQVIAAQTSVTISAERVLKSQSEAKAASNEMSLGDAIAQFSADVPDEDRKGAWSASQVVSVRSR